MYSEKKAHRQNLRVIVSEIIMVITVIITVIILALVVSGYWLNANFEVERQGMLQISSIPVGASVEVDGDSSWFQRTNTSKVLTSGEHRIVLTKDGYDSWSKTINIQEGLLYNLHYPRLFLLNRKKENLSEIPTATFVSVSPDGNLMLVVNNTTEWLLINLENEKFESEKLDISKLSAFSNPTTNNETGVFTGKILDAKWDKNCNRVVLEVQGKDNNKEWLLLDMQSMSSSINLSREFAADFEKIDIFDHNANTLLAVRNGNLQKINISNRQITAVLVEGVTSYDYLDSEIVFVANEKLGILSYRNSKSELLDIPVTSTTKVLFSQFYDAKYITTVDQNTITVYKKDDLGTVFSGTIDFIPEEVKNGFGGEFIFMRSGREVATIDMETLNISKWSLDSTHYGWIDSGLVYSVHEGKLIIYDVDGLNRRELASNVSDHFPVTITKNRWLYYFSDGNLIREWLISQ